MAWDYDDRYDGDPRDEPADDYEDLEWFTDYEDWWPIEAGALTDDGTEGIQL